MIKNNDFIELDFNAKIKDSGKVFDTTIKKIAEENHFHQDHEYKPIIICVGKEDIIRGLDEQLVGKEVKRKYILEIKAEKAFGKKRHDLIKLVPTSLFAQQNIKPIPGLQVNLNNIIGTIRSVSGGRTIVDFNHPLSGKTLIYEIEVLRIITDTKEKVESLVSQVSKNYEALTNEGKLEVKSDISEKTYKRLEEEIKSRVSEVKEVTFTKLESAK